MGWMFYRNPVDDVEAEIKKLCTYDSDEVSQVPIYITHHGSTWYAAVKTTFKNKESKQHLKTRCAITKDMNVT